MTAKQIKSEIKKVLDSIPEVVLEDILKYLQTLQSKSSGSISLSQDISKILTEDRELLERLAQ